MLTGDWKKPGFCGNSACVEVRSGELGVVQMRDSKDLPGTPLTFTADGWAAFLEAAKTGEFDL